MKMYHLFGDGVNSADVVQVVIHHNFRHPGIRSVLVHVEFLDVGLQLILPNKMVVDRGELGQSGDVTIQEATVVPLVPLDKPETTNCLVAQRPAKIRKMTQQIRNAMN